MSMFILEKRRQVEKIYKELDSVRSKMKMMFTFNIDNLTFANLQLLEKEEEYLLSKILKIKTLE
jgi:hypothetical protein